MTDRTRIWIKFNGEKMMAMEEAEALLISRQMLGKEVQAVYWGVYEVEGWVKVSLSPEAKLVFDNIPITRDEEYLRTRTKIDVKELAKYKAVEGVKVTLSPQGILLTEFIPLSAEGELDLPSDVTENVFPTEDSIRRVH